MFQRIKLIILIGLVQSSSIAQSTNDYLPRFKVSFPPLVCFYAEALPYTYDSLSISAPSLFIDTSSIVAVENTYAGYMLYVSNASDTTFTFRTSEDCLLLYAEVQIDSNWIPVTCIRGEDCASGSKRYAQLPEGRTFEIPVPLFEGELTVIMRYVLIWQSRKIESNIIRTQINPGQLQLVTMPQNLRDIRVDPDYYLH